MQITDLVFIDDTGYHFSDYPAFLAWLQGEYRSIYGADVYLEADSQDGQFLAVLAKAFFDTAALGGSVYNSFSPVTSQGVGLSRNVKINGLERRSASHSSVELTIIGQAGTVIIGGIATDALDQKWLLPTTTIPGGGEVVATAVAELEGAIEAAPSTVNQIFTPTRGWQTVNNATSATPGASVETDAELRIRQAQSTANPSLTVLDGTVGAVANLAGVTKVQPYENDTGTTDGNGIPSHTISLVVVGGDDVEIAQAIQVHKTPGTGTFGDTSEVVYDAHGMPLDIKFQRADPATIEVVITISAGIGWSSDYEGILKEALAESVNDNLIGATLFYTKLFAPAYLNGTPAAGTFDVASIEIGIDGDPVAAANIPLDWDQNPVCDPDVNVTVVVT